ncbi:hypothetical protein GGS21DRAFT_3874 [Xylaria nigripes]|nr:hypothetical protein GGS21DRAFT_3874 [Xylaria nigripes]
MLLKAVLLSLGVYSGLASANQTLVRTERVISCSYEYGSRGVAPTPIPTFESHETTTSVSTTVVTTVPSTLTVLAPTSTRSTKTLPIFIDIPVTVTLPTTTITVIETLTSATAKFTETVCADGSKPDFVTKYTGSYAPVSGQATTLSATFPTQAACTTTISILPTLLATATSGSVITTVTPNLPDPVLFLTVTKTVHDETTTVFLTTVTATISTYMPQATTMTSTVSCDEPVTKTMAAQCAPSNLIKAINNEGIESYKYSNSGSISIPLDTSSCCQACLDNEDCGAIMASEEECSLFYLSPYDAQPVCDSLIFTFTSSNRVGAGQGLVVQKGCGNIEYQVLA